MIAKILAGVAMLVLFVFALVSITKTIYHLWHVINGIRQEKRFLASCLGPLCFLMPTLFEEKAWPHRERLNFWLPVTMLTYGLLFGLKTMLV
jgi:hypothetical protein